MALLLKAYAKINLHLDVVSKAENGYHGVNTVMQTVSLCDDIEISLNSRGAHSIICDSEDIPTDSKNLAWRAADLFFEAAKKDLWADIKISKRIPMAAGLAGGSADAAAVFRGLNTLCGYPLSRDELLALGARLGADIPFCIACGATFADGFGERLHPIPSMPSCYILVACGKEGVSTPWAYSMLDRKYRNFVCGTYIPHSAERLMSAIEAGKLTDIAANIYNIFESAIEPERTEVTIIKSQMSVGGALGAMMSGSGPSVFGIFDSKEKAEATLDNLKGFGVSAFLAEPISNIE